MELQPYFDRIGWRGPRTPTLDVLHALLAAHTQAIAFENIDVLLGRPIRLDTQALSDKLVRARRGGYCFEQNGLLLAVLRELGFEVRPLSARVRLGETDRRVLTRRTHMLLEVRVDGQSWLADVGVGASSLTQALRWTAGLEQTTSHDTRRLEQQAGRWFHQIHRDGAWVDVYEFSGDAMPRVDREVANWYASTHPDSGFRQHLMVALARPDGSRVTLRDDVLTRRARDGSATQTRVSDDALAGVLRQHFGLDLPAGTRLWPVAPLGL